MIQDFFTPSSLASGLPYNLVINLMVPRYAPNLVWSAAGDGESWCVVLYCRLTEDALDLLRKNEPSPALKLWKAFVEAERQEPMKKRLKCIVRAVNADEVGFNTATRSLIKYVWSNIVQVMMRVPIGARTVHFFPLKMHS